MKERQYIQDFNFNINVLSKSDKNSLRHFVLERTTQKKQLENIFIQMKCFRIWKQEML